MSQRLPRRIGALRAQELMWSGRTLSGRDAAELGLANFAVPDAELEARTLALARQIAANSWFTLRTEKELVRGGAALGPREALAYERANSPGAGPDMTERLKSFGKK
jgi:enoyl-CoA hydratase/carnithine racemase